MNLRMRALMPGHALKANDLGTVFMPDKLNGHPNIGSGPEPVRLMGRCAGTIIRQLRRAKHLLQLGGNALKGRSSNLQHESVAVALDSPVGVELWSRHIRFGVATIFRNFRYDECAKISRLGTTGGQNNCKEQKNGRG